MESLSRAGGPAEIKNVYITTVPPNAGAAQASYFYLKFSFDTLNKAYENQGDFASLMQVNNIRNNVTFSPETFSDVANAAATILSLFRTGITGGSGAITADNLGLLPNLCMGLKSAGIRPVMTDINFDAADLSKGDTLLHAIIYAARLRAAGAAYSATMPPPPDKPAIDVLNSTYDNLATNMTSQAIGNLIQLDLLHSVLKQSVNYVLYITNSYSIGESRVKSNPIVDIFTDGPRISFIGGAGISYFLFHGDQTEVISAGHLDGYKGYERFRKSGWPMVPNAVSNR